MIARSEEGPPPRLKPPTVINGNGPLPGPGLSDRRITVMRIIDRLNIGGPAIHAAVTTKGLDSNRFRTVLVIGSIEPTEGDMGYLLQEYGITSEKDGNSRVVSIPSFGREMRPLRDLATAWRLFRLMREERPEIVHTHKAKAGAIGRLLAFACGVPVTVHTFHGHVLQGYFSPTKNAVYRTVERFLARLTKQLIVPSSRLADELSGQFGLVPRDRFKVVPLGFDLSSFEQADEHRGALRAELQVGSDVQLVGIVGRMVPVKDHATFVQAASIIAKRHPKVHFVFVGGGELLDTITADIEEKGLRSRSHLLGWRRDLARIYADLDVVALSSINEGTPVSLIEAMAAGRPVAATDVGGVADVFRAGARGELAAARNPDALAAAIERALEPRAKQRAAAIRSAAIDEYGSRRLCRDLEQVYDELLALKRK